MASRSVAAAQDLVPVTPGITELNARGLLCSADVTADLLTAKGVARTGVPLQKGYNPVAVRQVTAVAGGSVWALVD
jgi:hypothetical protein